MKPNIFDIATSELSQDSFFVWLLQWANLSNKNINYDLHKCAQNFVRLLINEQIKNYDLEFSKIIAKRQKDNIDIWAEVNDDLLIIIEDKTFTSIHSNQLKTYNDFASDYCKETGRKLIRIYLKTGSESSISFEKIKEDNFSIIDRSRLLSFFNSHSQIKSDIYTDFVDRIKSLEEKENTYENLPLKNWTSYSWIGLYKFLEKELNIKGWSYVSNQSGGFYALYFNSIILDNIYEVYLQIQQENLCIKVGNVDDNFVQIRHKIYSVIMDYAKKNNRLEINKPTRFGRGTTMTVAIIDKKHWLGNDENVIDKNKVVEKLSEYEQLIKLALENK